MAQTIQIKRSTGNAAPSTLQNGELAYVNHSSLKKLYIGRPGGTTGDIDIIGGKDFVDKLDLIGDPNTSSPVATANHLGVSKLFSNIDQSVVANSITTTTSRTYGIQHNSDNRMVVNVPWTDVSGDNKLPLAGGTLTGSLLGTNASFSSAPDTNNASITIGYNSGVGEIKVKNTNSSGAHLDFFTTNSSGTTAVKLRILDAGGLSISTGNVTMDGTLIGVSALGMGGAITGATSVQTDSIIEKTPNNGVSIDGVILKDGAVTGTGEIEGGSLDINGDGDISGNLGVGGTLTVTGDLNITGDVNSTSVTDLDVTDKTITVGKGQLGSASANSGLVVDGASAEFLYNGTQFEINDGDGILHGVIHEGNSATQTYTIDGGTF